MRGARALSFSLRVMFRGMPRARPAPYVAMLERRFRRRGTQVRRGGGLDIGGGRASRLDSGRGSLAFAIAMSCGITLAACGGDVDPYRSAVDGLKLPPSWQATRTIERGSGGAGCLQIADQFCPSVTRYFSISGELPDLYQQARAAIVQAGFDNIEDFAPKCDLDTNVAQCSLSATRGTVRIGVYLYPAGQDVDEQGVAISGQPTVKIVTRHS
jgi:hypothetical protein